MTYFAISLLRPLLELLRILTYRRSPPASPSSGSMGPGLHRGNPGPAGRRSWPDIEDASNHSVRSPFLGDVQEKLSGGECATRALRNATGSQVTMHSAFCLAAHAAKRAYPKSGMTKSKASRSIDSVTLLVTGAFPEHLEQHFEVEDGRQRPGQVSGMVFYSLEASERVRCE